MNQKELLALSKGTTITPTEIFQNVTNYVHRADRVSSLRKRLENLSKRGKFRMVGSDTWERS